MKLTTLLICITLFSCSKENDPPASQQQSANGSIEYKVNGSLVKMDNVDYAAGQYTVFYKQLKGSVLTQTVYRLAAQKGVNTVLTFALATDSLHETNFHYDSAAISNTQNVASYASMFNGNESALFFTGDYFDINITSYRAGRISGTFAAKLTPFTVQSIDYGNHGTTVITEGKINNVQVIY